VQALNHQPQTPNPQPPTPSSKRHTRKRHPQPSHCCSAWGHNFRKDYLQLKMLKQQVHHPSRHRYPYHHHHHRHHRHASPSSSSLSPARSHFTHIPHPATQFERVPLLALTATASPRVVDDVKTILKMRGVVFRTPTDRPNLVYRYWVWG